MTNDIWFRNPRGLSMLVSHNDITIRIAANNHLDAHYLCARARQASSAGSITDEDSDEDEYDEDEDSDEDSDEDDRDEDSDDEYFTDVDSTIGESQQHYSHRFGDIEEGPDSFEVIHRCPSDSSSRQPSYSSIEHPDSDTDYDSDYSEYAY